MGKTITVTSACGCTRSLSLCLHFLRSWIYHCWRLLISQTIRNLFFLFALSDLLFRLQKPAARTAPRSTHISADVAVDVVSMTRVLSTFALQKATKTTKAKTKPLKTLNESACAFKRENNWILRRTLAPHPLELILLGFSLRAMVLP